MSLTHAMATLRDNISVVQGPSAQPLGACGGASGTHGHRPDTHREGGLSMIS